MEAKTNYTIVGVIVLVLSAGLLSAALWLSVGFNQKSYSYFTVYLHEAVSGLSQDSPVKYNGVQVGFVKKIKLSHHDPRQVELLLSIEEGTPITTSTSATLISQGITGVSYVGLSAGSSDLTPLKKMPGEPYPVIPAKPSLFNQLDSILKEVSDNMNKVAIQIARVFDEENARYVRKTLANMEQVTNVIAKNSGALDHSLRNADVLMKNMATVSKDFPQMVKELKIGINRFSHTAKLMGDASGDVSDAMTAGKNTMNKLSQQTIPPAVILLHKLEGIAANLEKVSDQMRQNPSVVIRGNAPPKPGPGE